MQSYCTWPTTQNAVRLGAQLVWASVHPSLRALFAEVGRGAQCRGGPSREWPYSPDREAAFFGRQPFFCALRVPGDAAVRRLRPPDGATAPCSEGGEAACADAAPSCIASSSPSMTSA